MVLNFLTTVIGKMLKRINNRFDDNRKFQFVALMLDK